MVAPPGPIPPAVQALIDEFGSLFAEPSSLPPRRPCDHTIPLVLGAQPVSIRQYRYSPKLKSKIEEQWDDSAQQEPLLLSGPVGQEKGPYLAYVCRLPHA